MSDLGPRMYNLVAELYPLWESTEQVLSEWLGLSAEAVAALKADGAL